MKRKGSRRFGGVKFRKRIVKKIRKYGTSRGGIRL